MAEGKSGYGKRPMWQWILLYLVIGAIVYYLIYNFAFANKGGDNKGDYDYQNAPATNSR